MPLAALILDVDGTLAETEEAHRAAFNAAFAAAGLDWRWDRAPYARLLRVAGGKERIRHYAAMAGHAVAEDAVAALHADKTARYGAMVAAGAVTLRPGVRRLLAEARAAGLRLALATTTSRANVTALLDAALGDAAAFDVVAAGEDAAPKKPHPAVYLYALARLGLPAADCLAVEDSAIGLRAATAAGLRTVVTRSAYAREDDHRGAVAVVDDLDGIGLERLRAWHGAAAIPA